MLSDFHHLTWNVVVDIEYIKIKTNIYIYRAEYIELAEEIPSPDVQA